MFIKRIFSSVIVLLVFMLGFSKAQETKMSFQLLQLSEREANSSTQVSILVKGDVNIIREEVKLMGGTFKYAAGDIASIIIPASMIRNLSNSPSVKRMEEGRLDLVPLNEQMLINNRIDKVHQGIAPLTQGYDGSGVVVGVIDSGIDFTHPDFLDSLGNTRVLWVWDHNLPNATNSPSPYSYGQEFSAADMDNGLAGTHVDVLAHGTHVAGIAASNGRSSSIYTGAAPKADIIAVSVDFNKADDQWLSSIADAVNYIFNKADSLGKPCVINISAGTYFGSHDGTDLSAKAIDNLITAQNGRSVVAAAGNAGNYAYHVQHSIANDTAFTWFEQSGTSPIYIELWGDTADLRNIQFTIGADQKTPIISNRGQDSWTTIFPNIGITKTDTLYSTSGNKLARYQRYGQLIGGKYSMIFNIIPDSTNYYYRLISKGTGKYDIWNFYMINSGIPSPSLYPGIQNYVLPDYNQTICSSFQASNKVITVGQYVNRNSYVDYNGILQTFPLTVGTIAASSSMGPTRDGRIKPDVASTGEYTLSAIPLTAATWFAANQPFKLTQDGLHLRDGGTSSAAPAVAGAIALYLQKNPTATWAGIKNRVTLCAMQDIFTGTILPSNVWGYGKLDAVAVMTGCVASGVNEFNVDDYVLLFPNPSSDLITIEFKNNLIPTRIEVIDLLGNEVASWSPNAMKTTLDVKQFAKGMYLIRYLFKDQFVTQKMIVD